MKSLGMYRLKLPVREIERITTDSEYEYYYLCIIWWAI